MPPPLCAQPPGASIPPVCASSSPRERIQLFFGEPGGKLRQQPAPCVPGGRGPSSGGPVSRQLSHTQPGIAAGFLRRGTAGTGSAPPPGLGSPSPPPQNFPAGGQEEAAASPPCPGTPCGAGPAPLLSARAGGGMVPPWELGCGGEPSAGAGAELLPSEVKVLFLFFYFLAGAQHLPGLC